MNINQLNINFLGMGRAAMALSIILVLVSIGSFFVRGLNFGIDFTGGTLIEVRYEQAADLPAIRDALASGGCPDP